MKIHWGRPDALQSGRKDRVGDMGKRALILGISGQDGAYLAALLLENGYEVFGTSRDHETHPFHNLIRLNIRHRVKLYSCAINDFRSVFSCIKAVLPDEIYNLSGQTSVGLSFSQPAEAFESIATGTLNIVECVRLLVPHTRLFNACSSECFGNTDEAATEDTPFRPRSPYATSKATAFWTVANYREAYNLFASSGILFNHESPLRPTRFVTRKVISTAVRIAQGEKIRLPLGNLDVYRDWGWAPDYVDAIWRIMKADTPSDFIIASGSSYSLVDFVAQAFSQLGLNWQDHVDQDPSLMRPTDIHVSKGNPRKAAELLNWSASVDFPGIISRLIEAESKQMAQSKAGSGA